MDWVFDPDQGCWMTVKQARQQMVFRSVLFRSSWPSVRIRLGLGLYGGFCQVEVVEAFSDGNENRTDLEQIQESQKDEATVHL
jgi:hypothetical protein